MKESDILGVKTYSNPCCICSGVRTHKALWSTPLAAYLLRSAWPHPHHHHHHQQQPVGVATDSQPNTQVQVNNNARVDISDRRPSPRRRLLSVGLKSRRKYRTSSEHWNLCQFLKKAAVAQLCDVSRGVFHISSHLSVSVSVCLFVCLSVCLSLSFHLSLSLSLCVCAQWRIWIFPWEQTGQRACVARHEKLRNKLRGLRHWASSPWVSSKQHPSQSPATWRFSCISVACHMPLLLSAVINTTKAST